MQLAAKCETNNVCNPQQQFDRSNNRVHLSSVVLAHRLCERMMGLGQQQGFENFNQSGHMLCTALQLGGALEVHSGRLPTFLSTNWLCPRSPLI